MLSYDFPMIFHRLPPDWTPTPAPVRGGPVAPVRDGGPVPGAIVELLGADWTRT